MTTADDRRERRRQMLDKRLDAQPAFHGAHVGILEAAFLAELAITDLVSARLGRDIAEIECLRARVVGSMSVPSRLKVLKEIMTSEGWHDDFPFALPVLEKLFEIRNGLAHGITQEFVTEAADSRDWRLVRWSYRKGLRHSSELSLRVLQGIVRSTGAVLQDLDFMWVRAMPERYWLDDTPAD